MTTKDFITKIANPHWIVGTGEENYGELGFRIFNINFWYYKWPEPMLVNEETYPWRIAEKREFGEVIKSSKMVK